MVYSRFHRKSIALLASAIPVDSISLKQFLEALRSEICDVDLKWDQLLTSAANLLFSIIFVILFAVIFTIKFSVGSCISKLVKFCFGEDPQHHSEISRGSPFVLDPSLTNLLDEFNIQNFSLLRGGPQGENREPNDEKAEPHHQNGNPDVQEFNVQLSKLFIHLSALAYESFENIESIAANWQGQYGILYRRVQTSPENSEATAALIFYSVAHRFMIIVFKGTSPFNWVEWMSNTDLEFIRPHAQLLPGSIHKGFYERMFFNLQATRNQDTQAIDRYSLILHLRREINDILNTHGNRNWNVWVTGHSRGAAMATLFSSYLINLRHKHLSHAQPQVGFGHDALFYGNPLELFDKDFIQGFRAGYGFGTPRVGDQAFARLIDRATKETGIPFFRIIDNTDIVCYLPPGKNVDELTEADSKSDLQEYVHIGQPIWLHSKCSFFSSWNRSLGVIAYKNPTTWDIWQAFGTYFVSFAWFFGRPWNQENQIGFKRRFLDPFVNALDHLPSEYIWRLSAAATVHANPAA